MRSARSLNTLALTGLSALLGGCALLNSAFDPSPSPAPAPAPAPAVAAAPAAAPASAPAVAAPAPAARELPRAVAVDPAAQRAFEQARAAMAAGRLADAERGFKALTQSHPTLGGPHANLGILHRNAGRLPESVAALEKAVELSPDQPVYFNQLGVTYREAGQFTKARAAYEKAIALDAQYAAAHLNLAILFDLYLREPGKALEGYEQYLALTGAKDATVTKWITELKNRKPEKTSLAKKEQP
jgi:Flp pilus assembly protein TadD